MIGMYWDEMDILHRNCKTRNELLQQQPQLLLLLLLISALRTPPDPSPPSYSLTLISRFINPNKIFPCSFPINS